MKSKDIIPMVFGGIVVFMCLAFVIFIAFAPGPYDTNINKNTAELISCNLLDYSKDTNSINWEYNFGRSETTYKTKFFGETLYVNDDHITIFIDVVKYEVIPIYISNVCQEQLYIYLDNFYENEKQNMEKKAINNYLEKVIKGIGETNEVESNH